MPAASARKTVGGVLWVVYGVFEMLEPSRTAITTDRARVSLSTMPLR